MLKLWKKTKEPQAAVFEIGKPHPTSPPGGLDQTVGQVFDGVLVVTLWVDRTIDVVVNLIKRRVEAIGVWDGEAAECAMVFGLAANDMGGPGSTAMIGCVLPRHGADARLAVMSPVGEVVFVTGCSATREVLAVERLDLPAETIQALQMGMERPGNSGGTVPIHAPDIWSGSRQWRFEADDDDRAQTANDFTKLEGAFVEVGVTNHPGVAEQSPQHAVQTGTC